MGNVYTAAAANVLTTSPIDFGIVHVNWILGYVRDISNVIEPQCFPSLKIPLNIVSGQYRAGASKTAPRNRAGFHCGAGKGMGAGCRGSETTEIQSVPRSTSFSPAAPAWQG
jgi:hypothetical protein